MKHNNDGSWSTNSPSPSSTSSPIPLVHLLQEIKENMPENTASLTSVIASRKIGRTFKPAAPSRTTLKERNESNKREWTDDKTMPLINL